MVVRPKPALVVGVDGSDTAMEAVRWAGREAARHGWSVRLVRAYALLSATSPDRRRDLSAHVRRQLARARHAVAAAAPEVAVETVEIEGDPVEILTRESRAAGMLAVGARGVGGFTALLVGSVCDGVVRRAECPVVVARGPARETEPEAPVVVGVDGSPASESALAHAVAEADLWGAPLVAVHAWTEYREDPSGVELDLDEAEEREVLAERLAGWAEKYPTVRITRSVVHGSAARALVEASAGARAVVVGSDTRGPVGHALLGSVRRSLLRHARSPVTVVRAARI